MSRQIVTYSRPFLNTMVWPALLLGADLRVHDRNERTTFEDLADVGITMDKGGCLKLWSSEATAEFAEVVSQVASATAVVASYVGIAGNACGGEFRLPMAIFPIPGEIMAGDDPPIDGKIQITGYSNLLKQELFKSNDHELVSACICQPLHFPKVTRHELVANYNLTPSQAEYSLALLQDDETKVSYARIKGRSPATIEDGMRKARERLGFSSVAEFQNWLWRLRISKM